MQQYIDPMLIDLPGAAVSEDAMAMPVDGAPGFHLLAKPSGSTCNTCGSGKKFRFCHGDKAPASPFTGAAGATAQCN